MIEDELFFEEAKPPDPSSERKSTKPIIADEGLYGPNVWQWINKYNEGEG